MAVPTSLSLSASILTVLHAVHFTCFTCRQQPRAADVFIRPHLMHSTDVWLQSQSLKTSNLCEMNSACTQCQTHEHTEDDRNIFWSNDCLVFMQWPTECTDYESNKSILELHSSTRHEVLKQRHQHLPRTCVRASEQLATSRLYASRFAAVSDDTFIIDAAKCTGNERLPIIIIINSLTQ